MPTDNTPTPTTNVEPSKTLLDEENNPTPKTEPVAKDVKSANSEPKTEPVAKDVKSASLLDEPKTDPADKKTEADAPTTPNEEDVKKFTEGVKAIDLGDGVTWDEPALQAMTPALMKLTGNDPAKAEEVIKSYTAYKQEEMNKVEEANQAYATALVAECKSRFGADLPKVCDLAKIGAEHIFGIELWKQLRTVPQFCNNPDIIERFAAIGRTVKPDTGAVLPPAGKAQAAPRDWREGMYGKGSK